MHKIISFLICWHFIHSSLPSFGVLSLLLSPSLLLLPCPSSQVRTSNSSSQDNPPFHRGSSWKSISLLPCPQCAASTPQQVLGVLLSTGPGPNQGSCTCLPAWPEAGWVHPDTWRRVQSEEKGLSFIKLHYSWDQQIKTVFKVLNSLHLDLTKCCQNTGSVQATTLYLNCCQLHRAPNSLVLQTLKYCTTFKTFYVLVVKAFSLRQLANPSQTWPSHQYQHFSTQEVPATKRWRNGHWVSQRNSIQHQA